MSRYHTAHLLIEAAGGIPVYHGSAEVGLDRLTAGAPPYRGGIGSGVYVGLQKETALFYGANVYALRTRFGWDRVLALTPETWDPVDGTEGHSVLVGEHVPPFTFKCAGRTWTVGGEWVADVAADPEALGELIDLDDVGPVAKGAGDRAVFLEGVRHRSSVNEEMLVFDEADLEMLGEIHTACSTMSAGTAFPTEYPPAGGTVGGLRVTDDIPNVSSIPASMMEYEILDGVREVPMSHFPGRKARTDRKGSSELAREIEGNGWIDPLIVGIEADAVEKGPYILEGAHRFDALAELGIESFPAIVVLDMYGSMPVADPDS